MTGDDIASIITAASVGLFSRLIGVALVVMVWRD